MLFFNVRDIAYGAVGDGVTDDTAAIQAAINDIKAASPIEQCALVIPAGRYAISATLDLTLCRGLSVLGAGALRTTSFLSGPVDFLGTVIVPLPDQNAPAIMLDFSDSDGVYVRGISVVGEPERVESENSLSRAATGIYLAQTTEIGGSTANMLFEDVAVHNCNDAVLAGEIGNPVTSSDCTFIRFKAQDCTNGFVTNHAQAVNYSFVAPVFSYLTNCFVLRSGGVHVSQLSTYAVSVVVYMAKFTNAGTGHTQVGGDFAWITIDNARLDGNSPRTQLYVADGTAQDYSACFAEFRNVTCNAGQLATSGSARCVLRNGSYVRLVGCGVLAESHGVLFDAIQTAGSTLGIIDISGCYLPPQLPPAGTQYLYGTNSFSSNCRVRDCINQSSNWSLITDFNV